LDTHRVHFELHSERIPRSLLDVAKRKSRIAGLRG